MTSDALDRDRRARELFDEAVDLSGPERDRLLGERCAEDRELRSAVENLLRSHDAARTSALLPPIVTPAAPVLAAGMGVGPYRLLRPLGEGGMGVVYLAERSDLDKKVALKLVRYGWLASSEEIERFRQEQRVLARLEHAGIARLLDAGVTSDGLPWFAMEYVEGRPLDRWCEEEGVDLEQRLRLFTDVCRAVEYAHRNLIVHRDLKPSNVLVTADGQVKLLDFGIAKLLSGAEGGPGRTRTAVPALTPQYASPEQVRGEPVGTTGDVYSLGVMLYELLAGARPYALLSWSVTEIVEVVCHREPEPPSKVRGDRLARRLRGDLDVIVLTALRKDPGRRYQSVQEFREDVERHLLGFTVRARGDSLGYRARRFVGRHRAGIGATLVVLLSLIGGLVAALAQGREARRQRDLAVHAASTMIYELAEGLSRMQGPTESRLGLLNQAAAVFDEIGSAGSVPPDVARQRADADRVLAGTYWLLGAGKEGLRHARRAVERARALAGRPDASAQDRRLLVSTLVQLGDARSSTGDEGAALELFREAEGLARSVAREPEPGRDADRLVYLAASRTADRLYNLSQLDSAAAHYRLAFDATGRLIQRDGRNPLWLSSRATSGERMGDVLAASGRIAKSCELYRDALEVRRRAAELAPADAIIQRSLAISIENAGWCAEQQSRAVDAARLYEEGARIQGRLLQSDPSNTQLGAAYMGGLAALAAVLASRGDSAAATARYREAMGVGQGFRQRKAADGEIEIKLAQIGPLYAGLLIGRRDFDEAGRVLADASAVLSRRRQREPANQLYAGLLGPVWTAKGDLSLARGDPKDAQREFAAALALQQSVAASSGSSDDRQLVALAHSKMAEALHRLGLREQARAELVQGKEILRELRSAGELDDASDGYRRYLPAIDSALARLD